VRKCVTAESARKYLLIKFHIFIFPLPKSETKNLFSVKSYVQLNYDIISCKRFLSKCTIWLTSLPAVKSQVPLCKFFSRWPSSNLIDCNHPERTIFLAAFMQVSNFPISVIIRIIRAYAHVHIQNHIGRIHRGRKFRPHHPILKIKHWIIDSKLKIKIRKMDAVAAGATLAK